MSKKCKDIMGPRVYIVTTGNYSDYSIFSVHTDKDTADRVSRENHGDVACWPLDDEHPKLQDGYSYWRALMKQDGNRASASWEYDCIEHEELNEVDLSVDHDGTAWIGGVVSAKDEKHAIKILNERRAQILAMPIVLPTGKYNWPDIVGGMGFSQPADGPRVSEG